MSTKTIQGKLWSIAPQNWSKHFEPYFLPMYRVVLDQLHLSEDLMLLDAGCGSGIFASMAIETGAQVIGIDAAPGLLEVARKRNPQNNFMEEDLEAMPFAANSFDVVTGFNSFQYAGHFENALREAKRVLKPGATHVLQAIGTLLPAPPPGTPGPFALSEDGRIESICQGLGLKIAFQTSVACPFLYRSIGEGISSFMGTGPAAAAMNYTEKETVEATIAKALRPYRITDDFHFMQNQFLVFIAEK